jgi:hypothetical protein
VRASPFQVRSRAEGSPHRGPRQLALSRRLDLVRRDPPVIASFARPISLVTREMLAPTSQQRAERVAESMRRNPAKAGTF